MANPAAGRGATAPPIARNRLFWKLFLGFWLTLLAAGVAVGVAVWLHQQQQRAARPEPVLAAGPRAEMLLQSAAATLRYGGKPALLALLADDAVAPRARAGAGLYVVDDEGRDLLGRTVPPAALADARERAGREPGSGPGSVRGPGPGPGPRSGPPGRGPRGVRQVESPSGEWMLLFVALTDRDAAVPEGAGASTGAAAGKENPAAPEATGEVASEAAGEAAGEATRSRQLADRGPRGDPSAPARMRTPRIDPRAGIAVGLLASLAFSGLLAWYLTRPIRHLRSAFASVADGRLETRVAPLMGRRVDEIAALGHDFDLMAERLQKLIVSQRRLLHDVSHELRSPLARLHAAIGLARQSPERGAAMLERIEREAQRLDALVGELLTLARLEANATDTPAQTTELVDLLDEVVADARFEAQSVGKDVHFEEGRDAGFVIATHADWLQRAFENVIRNAIRHTGAGSAVEVAMAMRGDRRISVTVADRGPGVAADELETIFEPFQRGRQTTGNGGYGLGLAIARRAVTAHGGTIVASNRDGGGLLVTIVLPTTSAASMRQQKNGGFEFR